MSGFGPKAWIQQHWDWRAAANFVFGGTGSGLILAAAIALPLGPARAVALPLGLVLVALGLTCVWLEIGRPLRALHVFFNARTSWMTREAYAGIALFGVTVAAFFRPGDWMEIVLGAFALLFAWCQARILVASKGIPAWRDPKVVPFILTTALSEGAALAAVLALAYNRPSVLAYGLLGAALLARAVAWLAYIASVAPKLSGAPQAALTAVTPVLLWFGTLAALALAVLAAALPQHFAMALALASAGFAILPGWHAKRTIVTRASLNQGFSLPNLPTRGAR
jgi:phenylacetyl-CoA:acceptor oxidoreductase 26-kDa subunit